MLAVGAGKRAGEIEPLALDRVQVFHALELNAIRLALARNGLLVSWQSEVEISSTNMVSGTPYQKDYDAIVKIWVACGWIDLPGW